MRCRRRVIRVIAAISASKSRRAGSIICSHVTSFGPAISACGKGKQQIRRQWVLKLNPMIAM
eukprot:10644805-Karenia_brevis.AAC.1